MASISLKTLADVLKSIAQDLNNQIEHNTSDDNTSDDNTSERDEVSIDDAFSIVEKNIRERIFQNVISSKDSNLYHRVSTEQKTCTCPDFVYRKSKIKNGMCKHLLKRVQWERKFDKHFYLEECSDMEV